MRTRVCTGPLDAVDSDHHQRRELPMVKTHRKRPDRRRRSPRRLGSSWVQITRYPRLEGPDGTSRFTINVLEYGAKVESKYARASCLGLPARFPGEWLSNEIVYKDETHTFEGFYVKPGKDPQAVLSARRRAHRSRRYIGDPLSYWRLCPCSRRADGSSSRHIAPMHIGYVTRPRRAVH